MSLERKLYSMMCIICIDIFNVKSLCNHANMYAVSLRVYIFIHLFLDKIIQNGDTAFRKAVLRNRVETMKAFCSALTSSRKEVAYPPLSSSDNVLILI